MCEAITPRRMVPELLYHCMSENGPMRNRMMTNMSVSVGCIVAAMLLIAICGCVAPSGYPPHYRPGGRDDMVALADEVRARLASDDITGSLPLGVSVEDGVIVLRGAVPDEITRARAVGIALSTPGVAQVEDRLTVW